MDAIYRRFSHQYETRETNRIWNQSGTAILGYRNGRNETVNDMGTPDGAYRYYRGITTAINKREVRVKSRGETSTSTGRCPMTTCTT